MSLKNSLTDESDSVIEILAAQCGDLEKLLQLARAENAAVAANDFEELLKVVDARAGVGERLESYHRQIADLRLRISERIEPNLSDAIARRVVELSENIISQDAQTRVLLEGAKKELATNLTRLQLTQHRADVYGCERRQISVAYDKIV